MRNQLSREQVDRWSKEICENIMLSPQYRQADVIFGYLAFGNEPDIDIVLEQARLAGKTVCVPQIISKTEICAVRFEGFGQLSLDRYGIRSVSCADVVINPHEIALALVPGVGFAKNGSRINPGEPHIRAAEEGCDSAGGISSVLSGWNAALASGDMGGR